MITKSRTGKQALLKLTAIVPLSLVVLFIYACADNIQSGELSNITKIEIIDISDRASYLDSMFLVMNGEDLLKRDYIPAYFPGGDEALREFITDNIKYPEEAIEKGLELSVNIVLAIPADGDTMTVFFWKNYEQCFEDEIMRVIDLMPDWEPGVHKKTGEKIATLVEVPFHFRLNDEEAKADKMHVYMDGDKRVDPKDMHPAQYPGGDQALIKFLSENIKYPDEARKNGIEAEFKIGVMISSDGSVDNIQYETDAPDILEEEARRVIGLMPKWLPGYHKKTGKNVPYFVKIPFKFKLSDKYKTMETQPSFDNAELYGEITYPEEAKKAGKQGKVILKVTCDKTGKITNCEVESSTDKIFEQAALNAMKKVKVKAGRTKDGPVASTFFVPIHFKLKKK
jgi:TonB family protein